MIRWGALGAGAAVIVGAALVTASSIPPKPPVAVARPDEVKATVLGQKTGYFNMARVMRENKRAQSSVAQINERTKRALSQVKGMRDMYVELQKKLEQTLDENQKYRIGSEMRALMRMIEDFDREHSKKQNDQAAVVISALHDELRDVVAVMARVHGLHAVLAYPDAVTPEEAENPMVKELRLKPPACQPFYLDPSVDYTDELLQRLNARFAADGVK